MQTCRCHSNNQIFSLDKIFHPAQLHVPLHYRNIQGNNFSPIAVKIPITWDKKFTGKKIVHERRGQNTCRRKFSVQTKFLAIRWLLTLCRCFNILLEFLQLGKVFGEKQRQKLNNSILKLSAKHLLTRVKLEAGGGRERERERESETLSKPRRLQKLI